MGVAEKYNENGFEQTAMVISGPVRKEAGMQESDLLDQLPDGEAQEGTGTDHIMLVSLGCFCGPKLSFKHIGRGSETLPFDWMRTRHAGLMHFLQKDFEGFFDFTTKKSVPGCNMTTYRSFYHSFWHDDPTDPGMRERYQRRITRFNAIDAHNQPVLFVRCIPTTDELADLPELTAELRRRHGKYACLLAIIDFQVTARGAAIVEGHDNLLIYYLTGDHHVGPDGNPTPPYCKPVLCALDWIVGKPIQAMRFVDMDKIAACADETHWGYQGLGGLNAFEASLDGPDEDPLPEAAGAAPSAALTAEAGATSIVTVDDGVLMVSLGCAGATKRTLQALGRGQEAMPFDRTMVSHEGLLHFLRKGFEAPTRGGLGAGGQRPSETHGFFDFATRKPVPGTDLVMCRSHLHSFWQDDMADPQVKAGYQARIDGFEALGRSGKTLLFVRAVATTAELGRADELLGALTKKFGQQACLLVIVDCQKTHPGPYVVEGCDDILAYFLDSGVGAESSGDGAAPYREAVECALGWLHGKPLEAASVPDLQTLLGYADETCWGLVGPGGLNAFEGLSRKVEDADEPAASSNSAEDAWLEEAKMEAAKESIAVISLGSTPSTVQAFKKVDISHEASPFDGVTTSVKGLIDCLQTDFKGFSATHPQVAESSVEYFSGLLSKSHRAKLFVCAVEAAEDLGAVAGLLAALKSRFSGQMCLLVIVCGQPQARLVSVEDHYNVLAHFICGGLKADGSTLCEPIRQSLDWVVGKPVQASVVKDFESLRALAEAH